MGRRSPASQLSTDTDCTDKMEVPGSHYRWADPQLSGKLSDRTVSLHVTGNLPPAGRRILTRSRLDLSLARAMTEPCMLVTKVVMLPCLAVSSPCGPIAKPGLGRIITFSQGGQQMPISIMLFIIAAVPLSINTVVAVVTITNNCFIWYGAQRLLSNHAPCTPYDYSVLL